jgi:hypothetical protein
MSGITDLIASDLLASAIALPIQFLTSTGVTGTGTIAHDLLDILFANLGFHRTFT